MTSHDSSIAIKTNDSDWLQDTNKKQTTSTTAGTEYYSFNGRDSTVTSADRDGGMAGDSSLIQLSDDYSNGNKRLPQKRNSRHVPSDDACQIKRRMSSVDEVERVQSAVTSGSDCEPTPTITTFTPDPPEWDDHKDAWGYLQSERSIYRSEYLVRTGFDANGRTGYLLGRSPECDIIFKRREISQRHCLIYMESGDDGEKRGISIYLLDYSSNGTFVNGKCVGRGNRVMLHSGDRIQLYMRTAYHEDDERHLFYRIILPNKFETGTFHEEYKIANVLGKGNFASVYRARHKETMEEVAVKVLSKVKISKRPRMLPSIMQEIGILMSLEAHPGVIQIARVFNEPKYIYLVLEYVKKGELFQYVYDRKYLTEWETRFVFWQLFSATKFLHHCNIAHRDLKPENVLLVDEETLHVKITDFGLAKVQSRYEKFDSQCGTPNYVAPEILDPAGIRAYGKECDLWSLGVMLYICLCGFPPFNEELAPPTMKEQIRRGCFDFPSPYWDNVSAEAKDLIQRLLTVKPSKRATAREALEHPWMKMEPEKMQQMCDALDPVQMELIKQRSTWNSLEATQPVCTQSQSLTQPL